MSDSKKKADLFEGRESRSFSDPPLPLPLPPNMMRRKSSFMVSAGNAPLPPSSLGDYSVTSATISSSPLPAEVEARNQEKGEGVDFEEISPPLKFPEHLSEKPKISLIQKFKNLFKKSSGRRKHEKTDRSGSTILIGQSGEEIGVTSLSAGQTTSEDDEYDGEMDNKTRNISWLDQVREEDGASSEWTPPESWAVLDNDGYNEDSSTNNENEEDLSNSAILKVWKVSERSRSVPSTSSSTEHQFFDSSRYTTVTIRCPMEGSARRVCDMLAKRFANTERESARFRLYACYRGMERLLKGYEKPMHLQRTWLLELGYSEDEDDFTMLGNLDNGYLFRFIYRELPEASIPSTGDDSMPRNTTSGHKRLAITEKQAMLAGENLSVIPSKIFKYASTMEAIDLSGNCLLTLPSDLFDQLISLKVLNLRSSWLEDLPKAILKSKTITQLTLACNFLGLEIQLQPLNQLASLRWLDLSANKLQGLPASLKSLSCLTTLVLSSNTLDSIPEVVFELRQLKVLDISFNRIENIPEQICQLTHLTTLFAAGNSLRTISSSIQQLSFLKDVDIRGNLVHDLGGLLGCDSLTSLMADHNQIGQVKGPTWTNLTYLALSNNRLTGLEFDFSMPKLRYFDCSRCMLVDCPDEIFIQMMPSLETLNLSWNALPHFPKSLIRIQGLRLLNLSNNRIQQMPELEDQPILESLEVLDLHANNLASIPASIWYFQKLHTLNLSTNLLVGFPRMPIVISSASMAGESNAPLVKSLQHLFLAENQLSEEALEEDPLDSIALFSNLVTLNLAMNSFGDMQDQLQHLINLKHLHLSSNELTSLPDHLDKLRHLKQLYVNGNKLTSLPADLARIPTLQVFDASGNTLRYNISNYPYDWNWSWNLQLTSLDLSDNMRLDIRPTQVSTLSTTSTPSAAKILAAPSAPQEEPVNEFKTLNKLRLLNLLNVPCNPLCLPEETTTLRVRATEGMSPGHPLHETPPVGIAEWCGPEPRFDCFDFELRRFRDKPADHLIGLFDGRGDGRVSGFLYDAMDNYLHSEIERLKHPHNSFATAMRRTFLSVNGALASMPGYDAHGASLILALIIEHTELHIANVGDALAVLSRTGTAHVLSQRDFVWNREEARRVQAVGGLISPSRGINDEMPLTRAIGYHKHLPAITASPHIHIEQLGNDSDFLILGTEEVWHYLPPQAAVDLVNQCGRNRSDAARKLRDMVIAYGAKNSFSVLVIGLSELRKSAGELGTQARKSIRRRTRQQQEADSSLVRLEPECPPPEGDVCFIFTDIKNSTDLWNNFPTSIRAAMRIHNDVMRRCIRACGGYEVKTEGDAFMVAFANPKDAVKFGIMTQRRLLTPPSETPWPQDIMNCSYCPEVHDHDGHLLFSGLYVRMGIHGGPVFAERDPMTRRMDYEGINVAVASRMNSSALAGSIFISDYIYEGIEKDEELMEDIHVVDMGLISVKGLKDPVRVRAIYPKELAARHELLYQHDHNQ